MYNTSTWSTNMLLNYTYSILHFFTESNFVLWVIPDIWDLCASDHIIPNSNIIHKIQCWISTFVLFGNFCPDTLKQLNFFIFTDTAKYYWANITVQIKLTLMIYYFCTSHCLREFCVHLCFVMHYCVFFSFAITLKRKRKLLALLLLSCRCIVTINVVYLILTCCELVCSMILWYLLIILTYFLKILKTCLI